MNSGAPFSPRLLVALAGSTLAIFALCVFLAAQGDGDRVDEPTGSNSFSVSAVGHAGFYELLSRSDVPVLRGRGSALDAVGSDGVLVVAEPRYANVIGAQGFRLTVAPSMLLVLPRWRGRPDDQNPGWVRDMAEIERSIPVAIVRLVDGEADIVRARAPAAWSVDTLGIRPALPGDVQLVRSPNMRPLVGTRDGMLLGELDDGGRRIWVLADPTPIQNQGLVDGDNAAFALALVGGLSRGGSVVFDETVHGLRALPDSPLKLLLAFPTVLITAQVAIAILLLLLATMTRFGRPQPAPPPLAFGKTSLIGNAAQLLDYGGHHASVLKRYAHVVLRDAGRALHAPAELDGPALAAWLDRIGAARGVEGRAAAILERVEGEPGRSAAGLARLLADVRAMHRWRGELTHGA